MSEHKGPYFDDLHVGDVIDSAPSATLTTGRAAVHQAITGGRLRLTLTRTATAWKLQARAT